MNKFFGIVLLVAVGGYYFAYRDGFDPATVRDKRVLVTGSSSGIGEQMAYEYSKLGARLMLTARRAELLDKVARRCRELGAREVHVHPADMGASHDRTTLVAATLKTLGGLDQLILNHADIGLDVLGQHFRGNALDMGRLASMLNVNFVSFVDLTSQFLPALKTSAGRVAIVSSIAGKFGFARGESYAASKHALHGFFTGWRQDLRHQGAGVSFTFCVLGPINTDALLENFDFNVIGAVPANDTAVAIIRATTTRVREMYYGPAAAVTVYLHRLFPEWLEDACADYFETVWPDEK